MGPLTSRARELRQLGLAQTAAVASAPAGVRSLCHERPHALDGKVYTPPLCLASYAETSNVTIAPATAADKRVTATIVGRYTMRR